MHGSEREAILKKFVSLVLRKLKIFLWLGYECFSFCMY